ncbi:hypothetical protein [Allokutzneria multivorans]|uniref:hypothetical protein n=1 Tax=Allokutzneria multivorans TaxID=1142134 RepID=UPI0031E60FCC
MNEFIGLSLGEDLAQDPISINGHVVVAALSDESVEVRRGEPGAVRGKKFDLAVSAIV